MMPIYTQLWKLIVHIAFRKSDKFNSYIVMNDSIEKKKYKI